MEKNNSISTNNTVLTPEAVFVSLYVNALSNLQNCWMDSKFNDKAFTMQIQFLTNLIPDSDTRSRVRKEISDTKDRILNGEWGETSIRDASNLAGLHAVSSLVEFVCAQYGLIHTDITGPASSKQYQSGIIELPDLPVPENHIAGVIANE
jgi:hypothetical protein